MLSYHSLPFSFALIFTVTIFVFMIAIIFVIIIIVVLVTKNYWARAVITNFYIASPPFFVVTHVFMTTYTRAIILISLITAISNNYLFRPFATLIVGIFYPVNICA